MGPRDPWKKYISSSNRPMLGKTSCLTLPQVSFPIILVVNSRAHEDCHYHINHPLWDVKAEKNYARVNIELLLIAPTLFLQYIIKQATVKMLETFYWDLEYFLCFFPSLCYKEKDSSSSLQCPSSALFLLIRYITIVPISSTFSNQP